MRFGLFSDLHSNLPGLPERGYGGRSLDDLKRGLARFREAGVAFAVSLGDNTQPARDAREQAAQLSDLIRLWNGYGFPVHTVFGNHEFQQLTLDEVLSVWRTERAYDCFSVDGIRFVILDTNIRPDGVHYGADNFDWRFGIVDEAQAGWLREVLKTPERTFVFTHNCLYWETGDEHDDWFRIGNAREICDLLAASGCVEAVFQGHHHTARADTWHGIRFLNIPSPERSPSYDDADFPIVEITPDGFTVNGVGF
ncbi:MAG: metallophosphoesterase family protein [Clostridia bacterium]|nr:metallophosphoesterase family protein [Clostridia bacterium]